ncbi:multidrug effflux MFS transporter [Agromyces intestinalis]|uniref:Multidrug effflux MFS transporter n=1 Tax=Agromyces intestinalis TaxID=2592652 RepID=A0A5C1YH68_9MICO|nr:multidrug effflux MFS transporter [Agromyces intestinalis]QEO14439.1 multidrug effflux MFS transporter [Agromyces intestinalis]
MNVSVADGALPRRRHIALVVALGVLQTLSTFTIDIYLPAFPHIASEFGVAESAIQFTFTGGMIGMVAGQFFVGPTSDAYGRKRPMLIATALHVAASIACAFAMSVPMLVAARIVQGAASGATGVIALAMVRDLYSGYRMMRMLASMSLISGMAIAVGPLLGSTLLAVMPWRGLFGALAIYGLVVGAVVVLIVGETLPETRRHTGGVRELLRGMRTVVGDRAFVGLVLVTSCAWGAMYCYLAASSFLFQGVYGANETQYGWLFASHALLMLAGTQLGARIAHRIEPRRIVMVSTAGLALSAGGILLAGVVAPSSLANVMVPLWAFTFFLGVNTPCVQAMALSRHGDHAGSASSLLNATRQGFGAIGAPLTGLIGLDSVVPLGWVMASLQVVALVVLWVVVRPQHLEPID